MAKIAFFDLPEQLIHCICQEWIDTVDLSALDVAVSPCREHKQSFQRLLADPSFCTPGLLDCTDERYLQWLCKRNICVCALQLPDSSCLSLLTDVTRRFHHLRSLSVENLCIVRHPDIFDVFFSLPELTDLSLRYCYDPGEVLLQDRGVVSPRIERLDLLRCLDLSAKQLAILLHRLPSLCWLNLGDCMHFSTVVVDELLAKRHMQSLSLSGMRDLTDSHLTQLLAAFSTLRYLDISCCVALNDSALQAIPDSLTSLRIGANDSFTDAAVCEVLSRLPALTELDVSELALSPQTFLQLGSRCASLRELRLACCYSFDDLSLIHIAESCPLEIVDCSSCYRITDAGVIGLAKCCPRLQTVLLARCALLTDLAVDALAASCPDLRVLSFAGLDQLSDSCLISLAEHLDVLHELDISACAQLTDSSLLALLLTSSTLCRLDVSENSRVTSLFVEKLIDLPVGRRLRSLNISFCLHIDEHAVKILRRRFPLLSVERRQGMN